jgi:ribonucleotide monophosphatase NagD (HAD superfamily)
MLSGFFLLHFIINNSKWILLKFFLFLKIFIHRKIPFILLTNGGGITEKEKAIELSKILDFNVSYNNNAFLSF